MWSEPRGIRRSTTLEGSISEELGEESLYSIEGEEDNDIDLILETRISNSLFS
jgi:hypothetical protein